MPKEKIIIGIPAYGQGWTLASKSRKTIGSPACSKARPTATNPGGGTAAYWEVVS